LVVFLLNDHNAAIYADWIAYYGSSIRLLDQWQFFCGEKSGKGGEEKTDEQNEAGR